MYIGTYNIFNIYNKLHLWAQFVTSKSIELMNFLNLINYFVTN